MIANTMPQLHLSQYIYIYIYIYMHITYAIYLNTFQHILGTLETWSLTLSLKCIWRVYLFTYMYIYIYVYIYICQAANRHATLQP